MEKKLDINNMNGITEEEDTKRKFQSRRAGDGKDGERWVLSTSRKERPRLP